MPEHTIVSALYDEDWEVRCSCGEGFHARHRTDAETEQRQHAGLEGVAEARAELEQGRGA